MFDDDIVRPMDFVGPFKAEDYAGTVPLGNNDPTVPLGKLYGTPGNTPLNRVLGGLVEEPGRYSSNRNPRSNTFFTGGENW